MSHKDTVAVILAGGEGYRLRPFTKDEPKVMMPIVNKPLIEYIVEAIVASGIKDIVVVVGYKKEKIQTYFEDGTRYNAKIRYVVQNKQMGTLHALATSASAIKDRRNVLVLPGDNIIDSRDLRELIVMGPNTTMITESEIPSKYGVCLIKRGKLEVIFEKPDEKTVPSLPNTIATGIYYFDYNTYRDLIALVKKGIYKVSEGINILLSDRGVVIDTLKARTWVDIVYPWDLIKLNIYGLNAVAGMIHGTVEKGAVVKPKAIIGNGSIIKSSSYIDHATSIGDGCIVGPGCYISKSSIGHNVTIGANTVIISSVIMDDVSIAPGCIIENSVIGYGTKIGANVVFHKDKARYEVSGERIFVSEAGAIIGPDTKIGASVTIAPGIIIGYNVEIRCGTYINCNIRDGATVL